MVAADEHPRRTGPVIDSKQKRTLASSTAAIGIVESGVAAAEQVAMEVDIGVDIVTRDQSGGVDAKGVGDHAIRVIQVHVLAAAEQEAMHVAVVVEIRAHNLAAGVDAVGLRIKSA